MTTVAHQSTQLRAMSDQRDPEAIRVGSMIQDWREDRGLKRPAFVKVIQQYGVNTTPDYLAKLEGGWRSMHNASLELREAIRQALQISPQEWRDATGLFTPLQPGETVPKSTVSPAVASLHSGSRQIPVHDLLSAGPGGEGGTIVDYVTIPDEWRGDFTAYLVKGDSMSPHIPDGATIIVKKKDHADIREIVVCFAPGHGTVVKVLSSILPGDTYVLTSLNPNYAPIVTAGVRIYGTVHKIWNDPPVIDGNGNARNPKLN